MDEQTASHINKKKGYRIRKAPTLVMSSKEASSWSEKGTQTKNYGCHCFPVSSN